MYRMQICFGFKNTFFFKHKFHAGQILNFGRYLPKRPETPEIDRNDLKFFQSGIGTPWTKFLGPPLPMTSICCGEAYQKEEKKKQ